MSKEIFREEATSDTPLFMIDPNVNCICIKGVSMPENSFEFFDPLEKRTLETFVNHTGEILLDIELTYLNSMSSKQLLKLVKLLANKHPALKVNWKYMADDDLIRIKGEEIKEICPKVAISLVELN